MRTPLNFDEIQIIDEQTSWSVKYIYLWVTNIKGKMSLAQAKAQGIRKIKLFLETTVWNDTDTDEYQPVDPLTGERSTEAAFVWNDRATTITYL